jgi:electron transfer flavoprotein alpha subunit
MVGFRYAHTIVALNTDRSAPVFDGADVGAVGDWKGLLPLVVSALTRTTSGASDAKSLAS